MDILGPLKTSEPDQYKYVLVVVESLSKNPECFPLKTKTASEIASTLYKNVFCRYGAPKTLVMDNSLEFKSEIIQNLCQYFAVKRTFSSYYRPQTNASCERFNSTLLASLRCYLDQRQELWQDYLDAILMAYRATNCTNSTSFSPFFVLYGRHMQLPTDQALNQSIYKTKGKEAEAYLAKLLPRLELIREVAKQNIERSQESSKQRFDQRAQEVPFKPGMLVWLHDPKTPPHLSPKLHPRFTGPYYITAPGGNNLTFYLRDAKTNKLITKPVHAARLKRCYNNREIFFASNPPLPPGNLISHQDEPLVADQTDQTEQNQQQQSQPKPEWQEVIKLLAVKTIRGKRHYKVEWKNRQHGNTWVPEENVSQYLKTLFHTKYTFLGKKRKKSRAALQIGTTATY